MTAPLLSVRHLTTTFTSARGVARAVDGVSFDLLPGETLALVGESGSGKSVTALSILKLIEPPGMVGPDSEVRFEGRDILQLSAKSLREIRGRRIAMIFQEPAAALNPVLTIGSQIREILKVHLGLRKRAAQARTVRLLDRVGLDRPEARSRQYPHELSGGMQQRAMIAMALACEPAAIIADEPTTALDVTTQAQILDLLRQLQTELGMSLLLITHDLGIVAGIADRVAVMYGGQIVETGPVDRIFHAPRHPYTAGLLATVPRIDQARAGLDPIPGAVPSATAWPGGCRFHPRCSYAWDRCRDAVPHLVPIENGTLRCWLEAHPERRSPA